MGLNMTCSTSSKSSGAVVEHSGAKVGLLHCSTTLPPYRGLGLVEQMKLARPTGAVEQKEKDHDAIR